MGPPSTACLAGERGPALEICVPAVWFAILLGLLFLARRLSDLRSGSGYHNIIGGVLRRKTGLLKFQFWCKQMRQFVNLKNGLFQR